MLASLGVFYIYMCDLGFTSVVLRYVGGDKIRAGSYDTTKKREKKVGKMPLRLECCSESSFWIETVKKQRKKKEEKRCMKKRLPT